MCDFLTLHPYYIYPHYLQILIRLFKEKNPRQVFYNTHAHLLVKNPCSLFSFPLTLSYLERRFVPKHNPHIFKVQRVFQSLGCFEDLPKEADKAWWMQSEILWDLEAREDMTLRSLLVARAQRVQVHGVDQAQRVFCYSCTLTLFSSGSILTWRIVERFFAEFFGFLFDNTSWCYFVVASLFLASPCSWLSQSGWALHVGRNMGLTHFVKG